MTGINRVPELVLETDRLVLRTITEHDVPDHDRHLNTPAVMARLGGVMERHDIEARHAKGMAMYAKDGFSFLFMIEKTPNGMGGEMVGYGGLKWVDNAHAPNIGDHEIGWIMREDRWRRGYAYEAVTAILGWAFGRIGAPHVVALTSAANVGSWKLMEKLGMERREDLDFSDPKYPDEDNPVIQYSLTNEHWAKDQSETQE